jgi:hypothetical protein
VDFVVKLWKTLTGGADAISQAPQQNIFIPLAYSQPVFDAGFYTFHDVRVTASKPTTFQLIALVEGMESRRSQPIAIVNEAASQVEVVRRWDI